MNGVTTAMGYALSCWMGLAFYSVRDKPSAQWRGPLGVGLAFQVFMLFVAWIAPESPRFLLLKGRVDEARSIIMDLHRIDSDPTQQLARNEFYQMEKQAEYDRELDPTWRELFMRPSYRRRVILGALWAFILQSTGVLVINNYGPRFYKALGFGTWDQLLLQCGYTTASIPFNLIGQSIPHYLFRMLTTKLRGCHHG